MTKEEILGKVIDTIARTLDMEADKITIDSSFEKIGMDSLDAVSLMSDMEEMFDVEIPNEEIFTITTVKDVIDAIERNR